ncbi:HNH endonuclease [Streptomyces xanthophaeus]
MGNDHVRRMVQAAGGIGAQRSDEAGREGVQWVLQPRGGARQRGPEHFRHSVREGVQLSRIEDALGADADELHSLFPDGTARLWGSTPTEETSNEKAKALRGRRVGDEVLFYARRTFIARATILGLFRNPVLAERVWGKDDETGATWEHMMALGDVVECEVDAEPILKGLYVPRPLRSLTLRSAPDRRALYHLLREVGDAQSGPEGQLPLETGPPLPSPELAVTQLEPRASAPASGSAPAAVPAQRSGRRELLRALGDLKTHGASGQPTLHKPLALLWAIGRVVSGQDRLVAWSVFQHEVGSLMAEFGRPGSRVTPEYPFWHLRTSGLWEVHGVGGDDFTPTPSALRSAEALGGFTGQTAALLRRPLTRAEAVNVLCSTYFAETDRDGLLARVGLAGLTTASGEPPGDEPDDADEADENAADVVAGPVARRPARGSRLERNRQLVKALKGIHGHVCQFCDVALEMRRGHHSEAAHIQGLGSPHDGPDTLTNMLCLCPNHHAQFDGLALYIDTDWRVRRTRDDEVEFELTLNPQHRVDEEYVRYHRVLCRKTP